MVRIDYIYRKQTGNPTQQKFLRKHPNTLGHAGAKPDDVGHARVGFAFALYFVCFVLITCTCLPGTYRYGMCFVCKRRKRNSGSPLSPYRSASQTLEFDRNELVASDGRDLGKQLFDGEGA